MEDPKAVSSQINIKENTVDLMISRIFDTSEVPPDLIETVREYQKRLLSKGISHSVDLKAASVVESKETAETQTGKLNWQFQGINQFQSITIRIQDKTWQVEFLAYSVPFIMVQVI